MKKYVLISLATLFLLVPVALGAAATDWSPNALSESEASLLQPPLAGISSATITGTISAPGWVQPYQVRCSSRGQILVQICDCCVAGDHFEASVRIWDKMPTVVQVLASGSTTSYRGVWASSYWAQPLEALINVRYKHGINMFPAGYRLKLTCYPSTSTLTYTALTQVPDTSR